MTYEQRRELAGRIVVGIEHECWRSSHGYARRHAILAHRLGIAERALRALVNPARKRLPSLATRLALQDASRQWPAPVRAEDWLA